MLQDKYFFGTLSFDLVYKASFVCDEQLHFTSVYCERVTGRKWFLISLKHDNWCRFPWFRKLGTKINVKCIGFNLRLKSSCNSM